MKKEKYNISIIKSNLKSVFILAFVLSIFFQPLSPLLDYAINYEYIVQNLCVNRDQPILMCSGKCYLNEELAQETEDMEPKPYKNSGIKFECNYFHELKVIRNTYDYIEVAISNFKQIFFSKSQSFIKDILRPPQWLLP